MMKGHIFLFSKRWVGTVPRPLTAHTEFLTSRLKTPRRYLDLLEPIKTTIGLTGTKPDNYSVSDFIYHL